jgi:uncharacterized protein YndB with AHSA1/START domain
VRRDLHFEMYYPHAPEKVWRALTDRRAIERWLMPNDFELRVGHRFRFVSKPMGGWDGIVNCEVLARAHGFRRIPGVDGEPADGKRLEEQGSKAARNRGRGVGTGK